MKTRPFFSTVSVTPSLTDHDLVPAASAAKEILSVSLENSGITILSKGTLEGIWRKAETLIQTDGHVISVPWNSDKKERPVRSTTSDQPHLVKVQDRLQYCCDDKCPMFKGFSIRAHTLAAAQCKGNLELSVKWYVSTKCRPNLASIVLEGMPKGVGRKEEFLQGESSNKFQSRAVFLNFLFKITVSLHNSKRLTVTSTGIVTSCTSIVTVTPPSHYCWFHRLVQELTDS